MDPSENGGMARNDSEEPGKKRPAHVGGDLWGGRMHLFPIVSLKQTSGNHLFGKEWRSRRRSESEIWDLIRDGDPT